HAHEWRGQHSSIARHTRSVESDRPASQPRALIDLLLLARTSVAELRRLSALKEASRSAARHSAGRKNDASLEPGRCATVLLIRNIAQRNEDDRGTSRSRCDLATDRRDGTRCASFFGVRRGPLQRSAPRDASFARKPQSLRRARESALLLVVSGAISRRARQRRSCCW